MIRFESNETQFLLSERNKVDPFAVYISDEMTNIWKKEKKTLRKRRTYKKKVVAELYDSGIIMLKR